MTEERWSSHEGVPEGVLVVDATTGRIQATNAGCATLLGYSASELRGANLDDLAITGDPPVVGDRERLDRARDDGAVAFDWRVETGGGDDVAVEARVRPLGRDRDLALVTLRERAAPAHPADVGDRYRSLFENDDLVLWEQDFSEARAYAERLADTGDELRAVVDQNPAELLNIFERVDVHMVNDAALDFYGADSKGQLVSNLGELMTPATREGLTEMWQAVLDGERYVRKECQFVPLDGEEVKHELMELYVPERHADDYSLVFTTGTDITERKEREQQLADAKARYRRILDRSSDYVLICTQGGTIDYVSPGIESTLGYEPSDLIGSDAFAHVHPADRDEVRGTFEEMLAAPEPDATVEYRVRAKDGSYRWVEARGGNYLDDPLIGGVMVTIRDIVRRKRREQELAAERTARSTLQQELANVASVERFARAACAELVAMDTIAFAQIGRVTPTDDVERLASAGDGDHGDGLAVPETPAGRDPVRAALRDDEPQVTRRPVEADSDDRDDGLGSTVVTVPVTHDGVARGVLVAHRSATPVIGEERLLDLLEESADVLGYAMASDARRQALAADEWVRLTVTVETAGTPLSRAVAATGTTPRVVAAIPRRDDAMLCFLDVADAPESFVGAARATEGVDRVERVDDDGTRVQVVASGTVPSAVVADHGGSVDEARVTEESTTLSVRFPRGTAFDSVLDALTERFDGVTTSEFTTAPPDAANSDPLSALTDRQREVITAAYRAGYFEQPRSQNAGELAEQLGVARQTYGEILRAAQRNLLAGLLGESE